MIRIYPSVIAGKPIAEAVIEESILLSDWAANELLGGKYSIQVNGYFVPQEKWHTLTLIPGFNVAVYPVPEGSVGDALSFLNPLTYFSTQAAQQVGSAILNRIFAVDTPDVDPRNQGRSLDAGEVQANTARLGQPVRDVLGAPRVYPDIVAPSVRRFVDKRNIVTSQFLCVGVGSYDKPLSQVRIGETPIGDLGVDASVTFYEPGDDVSADSRSEIWYAAPEVGASSGSAGLDLSSTVPTGSAVIADSVSASGYTVTLNGPDAEVPGFWVADSTIVVLKIPKTVTVDTDGTRNTLSGDFQDLEPFVGMVVTVSVADTDYDLVVNSWTDNAGTNDVLTFDNDAASPFNSLPSGVFRIAIGYRGHQYNFSAKTSTSLTVYRLDNTGATDSGWGGFDTYTEITDYTATSADGGATNWIGPFEAAPAGRTTTRSEYSIFFPGGLIRYDDDGDAKDLTRTVEVQWRDADNGGAWNTITHSFTERTPDAIGFTYSINFPSAIRPQFQMRRVEPVGNSQQSDRMQWYGLQSKMPERPTSYDGVTMMAVTVRSGDRIAAATDRKISGIFGRIHDGETTVDNSISRAYRYITESVGIPESSVDFDTIDALEAAYWTPRGETFDLAFSGSGSVRDALDAALASGMSFFKFSSGLLSAFREGVKTPQYLLTNHEMTEPLSTTIAGRSDDDYTGVDVEYLSKDTWRTETVECRLPGVVAEKVETVTLKGATTETRAWRYGMRKLSRNVNQRETYQCSTELDARNFERGDVVSFVDDAPTGTLQSSKVIDTYESGDDLVLVSSEKLDTELANPRVFLRRPDGTRTNLITPNLVLSTEVHLNPSDVDFDLSTNGTFDDTTLVLCDSTEIITNGIIIGIEPGDDYSTVVRAAQYSDDFYTYDDDQPE